MRSNRSSFTEQDDAILRRCYASNAYGNNAHRKAVVALEKPGSAILHRAIELGLTFSRERYRWTEEEGAVLEQFAHLSPEAIQRHLRRVSPSGIKRTRTAIIRQIHRNRLRTNLDGLNHEQLAQVLGIARDTLHRYRREGLLRGSHLTSLDDHKGADRAGVLWHYRNRDIRRFVAVHPGLVNFRAADGVWLVDLLVDGRFSADFERSFLRPRR